jgi:hypothetical protein
VAAELPKFDQKMQFFSLYQALWKALTIPCSWRKIDRRGGRFTKMNLKTGVKYVLTLVYTFFIIAGVRRAHETEVQNAKDD